MVRNAGVSALKEESLHLFLGWFIELVPMWARVNKYKGVLIHTSLPHSTEWFVEYGYDIRYLGKNEFSGLKTLKYRER